MRVHAFSGNVSLSRRSGYDNWRTVPIGKLLYALRGYYGDDFGHEKWNEFLNANGYDLSADFSTLETDNGEIWFPDGMLIYTSRPEFQTLFAEWEAGDLDPDIRPPEISVTPSYVPPSPPPPAYEPEPEVYDEDQFYMDQYYQAPAAPQPAQPAPSQNTAYYTDDELAWIAEDQATPNNLQPASYSPQPASQPGKTDWMPIILIGGAAAAAFLLFGKKPPKGKKR